MSQRAAIPFLFEFAYCCLAWYPHHTTFSSLLFFSKKNCLASQENMPYSSYSNSNLFHFCRSLTTYSAYQPRRTKSMASPPLPSSCDSTTSAPFPNSRNNFLETIPKRERSQQFLQFLSNNKKRADCQTGLTISYEPSKML